MPWRHGHQAGEFQIRGICNGLQHGFEIGLVHAALRILLAQLDFEEHFQGASESVQAIRELDAVDSLNRVEHVRGALRLVALEPADQVEAGLGQWGKGGLLRLELLHVVLAEVPQACFVGRHDGLGRLALRHGNERYRSGGPAGAGLGGRDAFEDSVEPLGNQATGFSLVHTLSLQA